MLNVILNARVKYFLWYFFETANQLTLVSYCYNKTTIAQMFQFSTLSNTLQCVPFKWCTSA